MTKITTKKITQLAIMLALIIATEFIEGAFLSMPQGGGISLSSFVFLCSLLLFSMQEASVLFVLWRVLIVLLIPPFIVSPLQFILDYFIAYSGFLLVYPLLTKGRYLPFLSAIILANIIRYFIHVLTGYVYFGEYAATDSVLTYSVFYNMTYMLPTCIVQVVIGSCVHPFLQKIVSKKLK